MKGLTKKQRDILDFIETYIETNGYSPSYRDIQHHFSFHSLGTVYNYIKVLKRKQVIEGEKRGYRSITSSRQTMEKGNAEVELPFIGYLSAKAPIDTFPQIQSAFIPQSLVPNPPRTYALRVRGEFFRDELIADGDLLLVEARPEARSGEIVLACISHKDEMRINTYYPEGQYTRLESKTPHQEPTIVRNEEITIRGIIVGLIRFYE